MAHYLSSLFDQSTYYAILRDTASSLKTERTLPLENQFDYLAIILQKVMHRQPRSPSAGELVWLRLSRDPARMNSPSPWGGYREGQRRRLFSLACLAIFLTSKLALGHLICRFVADKTPMNKRGLVYDQSAAQAMHDQIGRFFSLRAPQDGEYLPE